MFSRDFIDFIQLLNTHKVEYMVVGGYAVNAYGYSRFTGDLDIWIRISKENAKKMMKVVTEYPAPSGLFNEDDFLVDQLLEHDGGTRLRIVHSGFIMPKNMSIFQNINAGWSKVVPKLIAIVAEEAKATGGKKS